MLKKLEQDMISSLKNKDKEKAGALRLILAKCKNKAIAVGHTLSEQVPMFRRQHILCVDNVRFAYYRFKTFNQAERDLHYPFYHHG